MISAAAHLNSCSALWSVDHKTHTSASSCSHSTDDTWQMGKVQSGVNFRGIDHSAITNSYKHLLSITSQPKQKKAAMQIKEADSTFCIYALKHCFEQPHT